jgi:hypothetical protein
MKIIQSQSPIKILIVFIGCLCALSGIEHGIFEILQGSAKVEVHNVKGQSFIYAIGESIRFWKYGYEYAYTIIPNYLLTGIITLCLSCFLIYWSISKIESKFGWVIFIIVSILQYITGGGAAQLGLALLVGLFAVLVNSKFKIIKNIFPEVIVKLFTNTWIYLVFLFAYVFLQSMVTAIFGFLFWIHDIDLIRACPRICQNPDLVKRPCT